MSGEDALLQRHGLELQVAITACQAIETGDPIGYLRNQLPYHNCNDYHLHDKGPLRYLLLLSDEHTTFAMATKSSAAATGTRPKLQPTAYIVIANRVIDENIACPAVSYINFCSPLRSCGFELAEGASIQTLALQCLAALPMYTLFNLLGQGYKIVLAGRQFGGVVAHAMASKLLMQVEQEIQLAKKMGIDLSALSKTGEKVVSFALSSPFFANAQLHKVLSATGHSGSLHTIWRTRDASVAHLNICGNMFSSLDPDGSKAAAVAPKPAAGGGLASGGKVVCRAAALLPHTGSPHFRALQRWAAAAGDEVRKGTRKVEQKFAAAAINVQDMTKAAAPSAPHGHAPAGAGDGRPKVVVPLARTSPNSLASPLAARPSPRPAAQPLKAPGPGPRFPSDSGVRTSLSGAATLAASPKRTSGLVPTARSSPGPGGGKEAAGARASGAPGASGAGAGAPAAGAGAGASGPSTAGSSDTAWKGALQELLTQAAAAPESLQPVGQFWVLDSRAAAPDATAGSGGAGKPKAGSAAASSPKDSPLVYVLDELSPAAATSKCQAWLAPGNKDLFTRWEYSLEELKRDLIEVYAWTTFKTTVEVDRQPTDRSDTMKPTRLDIM